MIIKASYCSFHMFNKILTISYKNLGQQTDSNGPDIVRPRVDEHPVLIARYMLFLVHLMQQFYPNFEEIRGLSEPPQDMMERLADSAISMVSTQDRLVGNLEGLECIMLEAMYYANNGSLRLSWAAGRRALHHAQLMGLHHSGVQQLQGQILDPKSRAEPGALWFRILHHDRYFSLLLGLPQGSQDCSVASESSLAEDTPLGELERMHCVITARVIERKMTKCQDLAGAQGLDLELQRAAKKLPSKWWLMPNLSNPGRQDENLFWDMKRLLVQMTHYNILNQIHLPFMLRAASDRTYEYSKIACVNASREILSRFIVLRYLNRIAFCCRTPDFMALMGAMTLILAHLESHRRASQAGNVVAHQYLSDRAMIEQAQESMEELSRVNGDALATKSADLLARLLAIEAEAADGQKGRAHDVDVQAHNHESEGTTSESVVRVNIPYFGVIKIAHEGTITNEVHQQPGKTRLARTQQLQATMGVDGTASTTSPATYTTSPILPRPTSTSQTASYSELQPMTRPDPNDHSTLESTEYLDQSRSQFQNEFGLTTGVDDWTFQGVDMTFFDSLLNGNTNGEYFS